MVQVSDQPPPPPVGSTPLPPPPGYAAVAAAPMGSVSLRRTSGVERAAIVLVAISALFGLLTIPVTSSVESDADAFLAGEIDETEFLEQVAPALLTSVVHGLAVIAAAVLVMIWMYRIAANHRALQRATRWAPGWAIGGWFLPPLLFVIPMLMLREMWKASDPEVPPASGDRWKSGASSPLIVVWFVLYSVVPLVISGVQGGGSLAAFGGSEDDLAEQLTGSQTVAIAAAVVALAAAAVFITLTRRLGARHRRLTGEAGL